MPNPTFPAYKRPWGGGSGGAGLVLAGIMELMVVDIEVIF